MQPEAVEYVLEPYKLYGPEFSFIQDLDCFLSEYDEGFVIPLQLGGQQSVMYTPSQQPPDSPQCTQAWGFETKMKMTNLFKLQLAVFTSAESVQVRPWTHQQIAWWITCFCAALWTSCWRQQS